MGSGRRCRVLACAAVLSLLLVPRAAQAQAQAPDTDFSLFGVTFGMKRADIDQKWLPLSGGVYAVSSPAIKQIKPSFDHEGRLYEIAFFVDLELPDDPALLVNIAFQDMLNEKWKKNAGLIVNFSAGRDGHQVGIIHEKLRNGYIRHLRGKLAPVLQP